MEATTLLNPACEGRQMKEEPNDIVVAVLEEEEEKGGKDVHEAEVEEATSMWKGLFIFIGAVSLI